MLFKVSGLFSGISIGPGVSGKTSSLRFSFMIT